MKSDEFASFGALLAGLLCWATTAAAQMVGPTPQPQGMPVTPEEAGQIETENWAIHGQATDVWLFQPAFRSPYQGPQSLNASANARETIDVTLYAGVRLWEGAEFWFNPEIDQGFGHSNTFGVAGYVSRRPGTGQCRGGRVHRHRPVAVRWPLAHRRALGTAGRHGRIRPVAVRWRRPATGYRARADHRDVLQRAGIELRAHLAQLSVHQKSSL